jgi:hypothetical protein
MYIYYNKISHTDIIDQVRSYSALLQTKESYLTLFSGRLTQKIDKNYALFLCDALSTLLEKHTLSPQESLTVYENCLPIYSYIQNSLFYIG